MATGDYLKFQQTFKSKTDNLFVTVATTDQADFIAPETANHRLYIQKIAISITTYAAVTWTIEDSAGTPVEIAHISIPAAAIATKESSGTIIFDFGPTGVPLTIGEGLSLDVSAAGAAGVIHVEAYEKLANPVAAGPNNY